MSVNMSSFSRYWDDPAVFRANEKPAKSYIIPYGTEHAALNCKREESAFFTLLNGNWNFKYYESVADVTDHFYEDSYDIHGWGIIPVPGNWQTNGYDTAQYLTSPYPFIFDPPYVPEKNPAGLYVYDFNFIPKENKEYDISFEGADSCLYLWINGKFIGYGQSSHNVSTFDITNSLRHGKNRLAAAVLKWCDGSYLEDQDKIRMSGIFRDVYILERDKQHIFDIFMHPVLEDGYNKGSLDCDIMLADKVDTILNVSFYDPDGREISKKEIEAIEKTIVHFDVENPLLWSSEYPWLYTVVFNCGSEYICKKIGFREVKIKDGLLLYNNRPIKFKGVNRHDTHPQNGYVVSTEHMKHDLLMMKRNNINTIRTSHYPNDPRFYEMCDELGFYVVDEADMESHGCTYIGDFDYISKCPEYKDAILDRIVRMVEHDKNFTCIFMWSLGNESGWGENLANAARYIRNRDKSRLIHMESHFTQHHEDVDHLENMKDLLDVYGKMYPSIKWLDDFLNNQNEKRPLFICEYSHAMGNSCGDLNDYWELFYKHDRLCGGCIWEWAEHAIYMKDKDGTPFYGYGGDFGEYVHFGNLCADGLVSPEREPRSSLMEAKNVYAPVNIIEVNLEIGQIIIENRYEFTTLYGLVLKWSVEENGKLVLNGMIENLSTAPGISECITIPYNIKEFKGEVYLNISMTTKSAAPWAESGHSIYTWQGKLPAQQNKVNLPVDIQQLKIVECGSRLEIIGERLKTCEYFKYVFNKCTGVIEKIIYEDIEILKAPMAFTSWRAPIDNDTNMIEKWQQTRSENYAKMLQQSREFTYTQKEDGTVEIFCQFMFAGNGLTPLVKGELKYNIYNNGMVVISQTGVISSHIKYWMPRYGYMWMVNQEFSEVEYFGYGPGETYIDKHHAAVMGKYKSNVKAMHTNYLKPQENGSVHNTKWAALSKNDRSGILFGSNRFSFNASPYTPEEIEKAKHPHELVPAKASVIHTDYFMSGVGSARVGPELQSKYRLNGGNIDFRLAIMPFHESTIDKFGIYEQMIYLIANNKQ